MTLICNVIHNLGVLGCSASANFLVVVNGLIDYEALVHERKVEQSFEWLAVEDFFMHRPVPGVTNVLD